MILAEQIRAARALLDWSAKDLATASGVSPATLQRIERAHGAPQSHTRTLADLKRALEAAGIEFVGTPDDPGVILHRTRPGAPAAS